MIITIGDVAAVITALAALGALVVSIENRHAIREVHLTMNSRLDELLKSEVTRAHASGMEQQRLNDQDKVEPAEKKPPAIFTD